MKNFSFVLTFFTFAGYFLNKKIKKFDFRKKHENQFLQNSVFTNDRFDHVLRFSNIIRHLEHSHTNP